VIGTSEKRLLETISFFSEPTYALDREGKVIAWNQAIAGFTGVEPKDMLGKGEGERSIPFFGQKVPKLTDMIFQYGTTIERNGYTISSKGGGTASAWTKTTGKKEAGVIDEGLGSP
jgi:PAS domain-containing protein